MTSQFTTEELSAILAMLEKYDVSEFELERGAEKLALKRGPVHAGVTVVRNVVEGQQSGPTHVIHEAPSAPSSVPELLGSKPALVPPAAVSASGKKLHEVKSPMVGTFYRRPAVDAETYVEVGDTVKKGDVLCIVEAMKLMNELEADVSGKIVEVCLEDAHMVEYGEVIFRIEPS